MPAQERVKGVVTEPIRPWIKEKLSTEEEDKLRKLYPDIDWVFTDVNVPNLDTAAREEIEDFADRYCSLVKEHKADVLLSSAFDSGALFHSYIGHHNTHLKCPSVESVVLCNSKGYTRKLLIPDQYNVKHISIPLYPNTEIDIEEIIDAVGLPLILKPSCGTASSLIQKCESRDELAEAIHKVTDPGIDMRCYYDVWGKLLVGLEEKYEMLKTPYLLAEECIGVDTGEATIHTMEVCIQNGRVIECEFADNLYWDSNPQVFIACAVPSRLPKAAQHAAFKMRDEVCQRLISYGMDNCVFNIETFAMRDNSVKVLEINPRMAYQYLDLVKMFYNLDKMKLFFDLQLGIPVPPTKPSYLTDRSAPKFAVNFYLQTLATGKATDIFDYEYFESVSAQKRGDISYELAIEKDRIICTNSACFCFANITGDDYEDCQRKLKPIFQKLFKNPSLTCLGAEPITSL